MAPRASIAAVVALVLALGLGVSPEASAGAQAEELWVGVDGNQLVNRTGAPLQLVGLNKSGTEYACAQGWGFFDGPVDDAAIELMTTWNINAVRVPLNEHCWLGRNGVDASYSGTHYRAAVRGFVERLHAAGLIVVLELHWSAAGTELALGQAPMPNTDHSLAFWSSVASEYRDTPGIVFELFNEPFHVSWECWRDGCAMPGGWQAAGMQQLLNAVRGAGASQPVIITGLEWGNDLRGWLTHRPHDPAGALAAGFHVYNFNRCNSRDCWEREVLPVAAHVPVVTSELGQANCGSAFTVDFLRWSDDHHVSYLPWTWNDWSGCGGPALLANYDGTPSTYGAGVRAHLRIRGTTEPPGTATLTVRRVAGPTRIDTAAAISAATFEPGVDLVFVARHDLHADALAAGPVAAAAGSPVLLTKPHSLPEATHRELERLEPRRIVVLGGSAAVEDDVLHRLDGLATRGAARAGGTTRYETAIELSASHRLDPPDVVMLASGETFADALAGGAAAAAQDAALLLTKGDQLPEAVGEELQRLSPQRVVVLGGPAAVSDAIVHALEARGLGVERLAGADRYETAARVAATFPAATTAFVATGEDFPDALAAVPAAGRSASPILLVRSDSLPDPVRAALTRLSPSQLVLLGGVEAVRPSVAAQLERLGSS